MVTNAGAALAIDTTNQQGRKQHRHRPNSSASRHDLSEELVGKPGRGTVRVANFDRGGQPITEVAYPTLAVPGEADRAIFRVRDGAYLRLLNDFTVGDIWLETPNARLDLNGKTLTVRSREHPLAPGTVQNYGAIIWLPEIPKGTIYNAK